MVYNSRGYLKMTGNYFAETAKKIAISAFGNYM
jgi:hypothetical protein